MRIRMTTKDRERLGILADEEELKEKGISDSSCFINQQNILQFYIKIISSMPGKSYQAEYVRALSSDFRYSRMVDVAYLNDTERIADFRDQLSKKFFCFQYNEKSLNCFTAEKIDILDRDYRRIEEIYIMIPYLESAKPVTDGERYYQSLDELKAAVIKGEALTRLNGYDIQEVKIIPYLIFFDRIKREYSVLGNFESFSYKSSQGGIRMFYRELKCFPLDKKWEKQIISLGEKHSITFIPKSIHQKIMKQISYCVPIDMKEQSMLISDSDIAKEYKRREWEFIQYFEQRVKEEGCYFSKRDLVNFHTAVKCSSLVILSGLSGTGKSQLVQCYAKALGLDDKQFRMLSVRPSWCDDSDLFGYIDYTHMIYRPSETGLTEMLIEAGMEANRNKMYLICFDEMNLARVEHYFSQFLSILEMPEASRFLTLYSSQEASRIYNSNYYQAIIPIGKNIRFVGTVNIDESTFSISDKVLDRANVIQLDVLPYTKWEEEQEEKEILLEKEFDFQDYKRWIVREQGSYLSMREREFLWKVHTLFQGINAKLGVGPRIVKQIGVYLQNLPKYEGHEILSRKEGFDIQFEQRVLTKLRGQREVVEQLLNRETADTLYQLIKEYRDISEFVRTERMLIRKERESMLYGYTL